MSFVSEIRSRLVRAFPENQADLLAEVLVESHAELVNRADFHKLTEVVHDLGEAQKRTEMRVEELADAQKRTEIHVDELARSHQEMRATMQEMQATMQDMQASQQAMQGSLQEMQRAVTDLAKQVGGLSNAVGANLEDFACDLVPELLEKYWRFVTVSAGPEELTTADGVGREFDVVVRGTIDGRPVTVLCETKATVSTTEVSKFLRIVEKVRGAYPGEDIRPLFFGYKANSAARGLITQSHAAMIFTRGVMIPVAA
jgi:DNA repair ATPase RecN